MGSRPRPFLILLPAFACLLAASFAFALIEGSPITLDSVSVDQQSATADGTYADGWKWTFHFTVPTVETQFRMQFTDYTSGDSAISAANNIRIYSPQSAANTDEASAISVSAAKTYTSEMTLSGDTAPGTPGRQIDVIVEMQVPPGSANGAYSGTYLVDTELPPDTTPPIIAAHSDITSEATGASGAAVTYTAPTATDNVDASVSVSCAPASGSTFALGTTTVTCNASDAAGNAATPVTFGIGVVDTTPPIITLNDPASVSLTVGDPFTDPGATATDAVDGTNTVTTSGSVDTSKAGTYTLTYNAVDAAHNHATPVTRTVTVSAAGPSCPPLPAFMCDPLNQG